MTEPKPSYITVSQGMAGWFAVKVWWNPDMGGFYEPWDTGDGRYATRELAEQEACEWATAEEMEYRK